MIKNKIKWEGDIKKLKEEDRRFLMNIHNQNIQNLQSMGQHKENILLIYTSLYLSLLAILIASQNIKPYAYIVTAIFIVCFLIIARENIGKLIRNQTEAYKVLKELHFRYIKPSKKS